MQQLRTSRCMGYVVLFVMISPVFVLAQSSEEIQPPLQQIVPMSTVGPNGQLNLPMTFAMAGIAEDGSIEVIRSIPQPLPVDEDAEMELVEQTYTVAVPYTEMVEGRAVTRYRTETRTRTVQVVKGPQNIVAESVTVTHDFDELQCFSSNGKPISKDEVERRFSERVPAVLIHDKNQISPFFEALVKPDTVFIVLPAARPNR